MLHLLARINAHWPSATLPANRCQALIGGLTILTLALAPALKAETVTYRLIIDNTWSQTTHPGKMPPERAHFSWLGGGTHNDQVSFWNEGEVASPAMVEMAETGVIDMLANQVRSQIGQGTAFGSLAWRWWVCADGIVNTSCGTNTFEFEVDEDFPLVSLVTMLGPSPDWFVGTNGLNLRDGNGWRQEVVVDLHPYDGGTRSDNEWLLYGTENNPPEPIQLITAESGQLVGPTSLGTMTFKLLAETDDGYPPGTLVPSLDLALQTVPVLVPEQFRGTVSEDLTLNLPPGFSASVFAYEGLSSPRFMAFNDADILHVANMGRDQIVAFPDRNGDGVADERIISVTGLEEAHSLFFYQDYLYIGEEHQVIRLRDSDGDLVYEEREVVLADIPWEGWHDTRTAVVDRINDKMYVSVGSPCDLCRMDLGFQMVGNSTDMVPQHPERGTIVQFNPDGSDRRVFATGVRNVIGMDFHPVTNELWGNNNGHDLEGRTAPPEWVDIIRDDDFMGYPLVHSHQVWNDFEIEPYQRVLPISREDSARVAKQKRPVALVPAHYAPMGIHFYTGNQFPKRYKNAALVAYRAGKAKLSSHPGYMVSAIFSDPDGANAEMGSFITGFQRGNTTDDVWGFPVGLATDAQGSLYVTSDSRNELVLKITHSLVTGSWEGARPASTAAVGQVFNTQALVRLERFDETGGPVRVTADLSALGGPAEVLLEAVGDDTYELEISLPIDSPPGAHTLSVLFVQEADGVVHRMLLPHTVTVEPALSATWEHSLPDVVTQGSILNLNAEITIQRLHPDGGTPRLSADLSAFGGPADQPLEAIDADTYRLAARLETNGLPTGPLRLNVRLEQDIDGAAQSFDFFKTIDLLPQDLAVLDEKLSTSWQFFGLDGAQVLDGVEGPVYHGTFAAGVSVEPPNRYNLWKVDFQPEQPIQRLGFAGIRFAFHPGEAELPARLPRFFITVDGLTLDLLGEAEGIKIDFAQRDWQVVEIPFDAFAQNNFYGEGLRDQVDMVDALHFEGNMTGTFYLDDVRIVTRIPAAPPTLTAVLEERQGTTPADFTLEQNYPNPFNNDTIIRFALPQRAEGELTVYNLAGQQVAQLWQGQRPAGHYALNWDGRSDRGDDLATGVYIYRLQIGNKVLSRKLLLLR